MDYIRFNFHVKGVTFSSLQTYVYLYHTLILTSTAHCSIMSCSKTVREIKVDQTESWRYFHKMSGADCVTKQEKVWSSLDLLQYKLHQGCVCVWERMNEGGGGREGVRGKMASWLDKLFSNCWFLVYIFNYTDPEWQAASKERIWCASVAIFNIIFSGNFLPELLL